MALINTIDGDVDESLLTKEVTREAGTTPAVIAIITTAYYREGRLVRQDVNVEADPVALSKCVVGQD